MFDAREYTADADDYEPFQFVGLDGDTYELPNLLTLTERDVSALRSGDESRIRDEHPEAYEALQEMPMHISLKLAEQWWGQMGEAGKSPSPSRAIRRATGRSRPTSRSGASTSTRSKSAK